MGVRMETIAKKQYLLILLTAFIGLPLVIWVLGVYPVRTVLKETISVITILAYFMMVAQFFLSRANSGMTSIYRFKNILKWHKFIGYFFVGVFVLHPLLIVVPRFFESGILPQDAFWKLITTFETTGQIVGLIAYILMFVLGATSVFRDKLGIKYKTWKYLHGVLSVLFIILATWHAVDMGRHTQKATVFWMVFLAFLGTVMLLKTYIPRKELKHEVK